MGRPTAVPFSKRLEILRTLNIFHESGELKKERDEIWKTACKELDGKITTTTLYLSVRSNEHNILEELEKIHGIKNSNIKSVFESDVSDYSDGENYSHDSSAGDTVIDSVAEFLDFDAMEKNPRGCAALNFTLTLCEKKWAKIKPCVRTYADGREYTVLKPDVWTHVIADEIIAMQKLPCAFAFSNNHVYSRHTNKPFFTFFGRCTERHCRTFLYGECSNNYSVLSESVNISVYTFDTKKIKHKKKRKFAGIVKKKDSKELRYVKAKRFREKKAVKTMHFGDLSAATLQTSVNYRKNRERAIAQDLNLSGPSDVYKSLIFLKKKETSIRHVQKFPFLVRYITDDQVELWKALFKSENRFCVSIDASGCFAKSVKILDRNTSHLFLHVIVTQLSGHNKIVPLAQMLGEKNDTNTIQFWLKDLKLSHGVPDPIEVYSDGNLALLNAACLAYNNCTYKNYLNICFEYLRGAAVKLKPCFVRLDKAHMIKAASRWNCFTKKNSIVKDFYLRCIGYSFEIEELRLLEDLILTIFIVSQSTVCVPNSECEKRKAWMIRKFETFDHELYLPEKTGREEVPLEDSHEMRDGNYITTYLQDLYKRAENLSDISDDPTLEANPFVCKKIKGNIIHLFSQFPAMVPVMVQAYKSPYKVSTSARSEAFFKDKRAVDLPLPISANKFILHDISVIHGISILIKSKLEKDSLKFTEGTPENINFQVHI